MNTKPAHTAGPWKQHGTFIWSPAALANIAALSELRPGHVIEYVPPEVGSKNLEEIFANGRLLAAAPDLLEELQHMVDMVEFLGLQGPPELEPKVERTVSAARAAIAKAKGDA